MRPRASASPSARATWPRTTRRARRRFPAQAGAAELAIGDSLVSGNIEGVIAMGAGARAWVSGNIVSGNGTGFWNYGSGAVFESAGNNAMRHNATDLIGTIGAVVTK